MNRVATRGPIVCLFHIHVTKHQSLFASFTTVLDTHVRATVLYLKKHWSGRQQDLMACGGSEPVCWNPDDGALWGSACSIPIEGVEIRHATMAVTGVMHHNRKIHVASCRTSPGNFHRIGCMFVLCCAVRDAMIQIYAPWGGQGRDRAPAPWKVDSFPKRRAVLRPRSKLQATSFRLLKCLFHRPNWRSRPSIECSSHDPGCRIPQRPQLLL